MKRRTNLLGRLRRPGRVLALGFAALVPTCWVLLLSIPTLFGEAHSQLPCPLYPNGVVAFGADLHEACGLRYGDRIEAISRGGEVHTVDSAKEIARLVGTYPPSDYHVYLDAGFETSIRSVHFDPVGSPARLIASVLLCGLLLTIVCLTAIRAQVLAALPFAGLYGSVGALIAASTAGWAATDAYPWVALSRAMLSAAIIDLALVFPRARGSVISVPMLRLIPYLVCGLLWMGELDAAYRGDHSTMLLVQRVLIAAATVGGGLLCLSCFIAGREPSPLMERRQAGVFLKGHLTLGVVIAFLWSLDRPGGLWSVATVAAALSPLPLGYSIARYHLFDLDLTVRKTISHAVYLLALTAILFVPVFALRDSLAIAASLRPAPILFACVLGCVAVFDLARAWIARSVETAFRPMSLVWEPLSDLHPRADLEGSSQVDKVGSEIGARLARGFRDTDVSVFSVRDSRFSVIHASGPCACIDTELASTAAALFPGRIADLNRVALEERGMALYQAGVELSCPIQTHEETVGWILLSPKRRGTFISSGHLGFLGALADEAAVGLHGIALAEALSISNQFAAKGRVHAELAHEIGKPLGTLEVLARRLDRGTLPGPARDKAISSMARLAAQLRSIVRGVLEESPMPTPTHPVQIHDLVERSLREISEVRGEGRVVVHPIPNLPGLSVGAHALVRALTNLLDNAIHASLEGQVCELRVFEEEASVVFEIRDYGVGIPVEQLSRVMDPFVTHREGGNGLGLSIAREVAQGLGGTLHLESKRGQGTRACIAIPRLEAA